LDVRLQADDRFVFHDSTGAQRILIAGSRGNM
jgi:hypothetical protein